MIKKNSIALLAFAVVLVAGFSVFSLGSVLLPKGISAAIVLFTGGLWVAMLALVASAAINAANDQAVTTCIENQKLQAEVAKANRANQRFWSNVSHELRTPLNSILGYSDLILDSDELEADDSLRADLQKISSAGMELLTLVNDVLTVSGVEVREAPSTEVVDIQQLVRSVELLARPLAERNHLEFVADPPAVPLEAKVDPRRLERVILSLVMNAVKYTEEGGIRVSYRMDKGAGGERLVFEFEDSGPPLNPNVFTEGFKPFAGEAVESGLRDNDLGLVVCARIVDEMSASVSVTREDDVNTFILAVPAEVQERSQAEMVRRATLKHTPDVLVIDESDDSAELLSRYMKRRGFRVTVSNDSAAGKDIAVLLQPDAIVLDLDSTSIDGWAVLQHLRFDSRTRDIPVIATSVRRQGDRAKQLDVEQFLIKPVTSGAIYTALAAMPTFAGRLTDPPGASAELHG